ncbi:hypothetical protein ACWEN6_01505 [Sphaerisporangium sp. NPDC004334]
MGAIAPGKGSPASHIRLAKLYIYPGDPVAGRRVDYLDVQDDSSVRGWHSPVDSGDVRCEIVDSPIWTLGSVLWARGLVRGALQALATAPVPRGDLSCPLFSLP